MLAIFLELSSKRHTLVPSAFVPLDQLSGNCDSSSRQASMHSKGRRLEVRDCKRLYQSSGKEKESCCLGFTFSKKREIRYFPSWSCNDGKEMYKKAWCTFCQSKPITFSPFSLTSPWSFLKLSNHRSLGRSHLDHPSSLCEKFWPGDSRNYSQGLCLCALHCAFSVLHMLWLIYILMPPAACDLLEAYGFLLVYNWSMTLIISTNQKKQSSSIGSHRERNLSEVICEPPFFIIIINIIVIIIIIMACGVLVLCCFRSAQLSPGSGFQSVYPISSCAI